MNLHDADLRRRLTDYLTRRQPPRSFAHNEAAQADQINAYLRAIRRYAPEGDALTDWWAKFLDGLSEGSETWAWPSEREVWNACKAASRDRKPVGHEWRPDGVKINLGRLERGEPIGDEWLWGAGALRLIAAGASPHTLRERRIALVQYMADLYGPEAARPMVLALKARHEDAIARRDEWLSGHDTPHQRAVALPAKRAFTDDDIKELVA